MIKRRTEESKVGKEGHNIPVSRSTSHSPLFLHLVVVVQSVRVEPDFFKKISIEPFDPPY